MSENHHEPRTGGGSGAAPLFAAVEARDKFFDLRYERADYSGLRPRRMVWRCRCCAPEIYQCEAATAEEAIAAALAKASELEANAGGMARELAAQDSDNSNDING